MTEPTNPYQPPEPRPEPTKRAGKFGRNLRIGLAVFGLFFLFGRGPSGGNPAYHDGLVFIRVLGAGLLLLAVFPFRGPRAGREKDVAEDL